MQVFAPYLFWWSDSLSAISFSLKFSFTSFLSYSTAKNSNFDALTLCACTFLHARTTSCNYIMYVYRYIYAQSIPTYSIIIIIIDM